MTLTENALRVLEKRYLSKDSHGRVVETPEALFRRVAANIVLAEHNYGSSAAEMKKVENEFYKAMSNLEFLPNSPTLMNAGRELQQLSACFVLHIEDSMESIFNTLRDASLIHKSGGGTGFSFSRLRPKNDMVKTTQGISSGPLSFMKVYNAATETIKQGGTRRGANMGILRVDHPDIIEFIKSKLDPQNLTNFNISVSLTDKFMKAVARGEKYSLINPRSGKEVEKLPAREVFDTIVKMAWATGEPGIIFIDTINKHNPTPQVGAIESTNPCGEVPLLPYESCNLGSINLSRMLKAPKFDTIDWDKLERTVTLAVRFLDNIIDMNRYPLPRIEEMTKANRKIGLGVMGFADTLIHLGIPYDSDKAVKTAEKLMKFIRDQARTVSAALAKKRGAFKNFKGSVFDNKGQPKLRNATVTSIAPTGTISIIAGSSSGIEPVYAITYIRNVMDHDKLVEIHPLFRRLAEEHKFYSDELISRIIANKGSIQTLTEVPDAVKRLFVTAHDISPEWHIRIQAAFQKYTDNAVSKTINFPNQASEADVDKAYKLAFKLGFKGLTVYRDGTRHDQVLSIHSDGMVVTPAKERIKKDDGDVTVKAKSSKRNSGKISPRKRPASTTGVTEIGSFTSYGPPSSLQGPQN